MTFSFSRAPLLHLVLGLSCLVSAQECDSTTKACDTHKLCPVWKAEGECENNPDYMLKYCPVSCPDQDSLSGSAKVVCEDKEERCMFWAENNECKNNPNYMHVHCAKSCKTCNKLNLAVSNDNEKVKDQSEVKAEDPGSVVEQSTNFGKIQEAIGHESFFVAQQLEETVRYMKTVPPELRGTCKNKENLCTFWSLYGECEENKLWMDMNCGPACRSCDVREYSIRCPKLEKAVPALLPNNGLDQMFERIVSSAPGNRTDITPEEWEELQLSRTPLFTAHVHSSNPWVITLDDFLTHSECEAMVLAGYNKRYMQSKRGFSSTPEHAWCTDEERGCRTQFVPQQLHERLSRVLGIPASHMENFKLSKYEKDQFYAMQHDYVATEKDLLCGPSIVSIMIYLNDVEEGGEMSFPSLNLRIPSKQGRVVLWPNVLPLDPTMKESKTLHQTYPVILGTKFTASSRVHLFDWVTPSHQNCLK